MRPTNDRGIGKVRDGTPNAENPRVAPWRQAEFIDRLLGEMVRLRRKGDATDIGLGVGCAFTIPGGLCGARRSHA